MRIRISPTTLVDPCLRLLYTYACNPYGHQTNIIVLLGDSTLDKRSIENRLLSLENGRIENGRIFEIAPFRCGTTY
jgi:hypothetical protein